MSGRARSNAISGGQAPFIGAQRSAGPARTPMMGAHRQQEPQLEMQAAVGNQETLASSSSSSTSTMPTGSNVPEGAYSGGYADYRPMAPTAASAAPASPAIAPSSNGNSAPSDNTNFAMKSMLPGMTGFDSSVQRPNPHMKTSLPSTTFYADTAEKRAPYARGFNDKGQMSSVSDGSSLNTIGAERPAAIGAKGDRHIFTMDGEGQFYTGDAIQENTTRGREAADQGASQQERFHHSSFLGGEDVAGAGEMQVRDGQVELVSDTSGHYRPGSKQMMQTVQQLEKNKVQTERLGVEFVGKNGTQNMQASATELLGYADHNPETAEDQMREKHNQKNSVLGELLNKSRNNPDGQNLKPSELNRRPEEAAPESVAEQEGPESEIEDEIKYENEDEEEIKYENDEDEDEVVYTEDEHFEAEDEDEIKYNS